MLVSIFPNMLAVVMLENIGNCILPKMLAIVTFKNVGNYMFQNPNRYNFYKNGWQT